MLCSDSMNNSEIEVSLTSDLLELIQNSTHVIGEIDFKSLDKVMFCKIYSGEKKTKHFFMIILIQKDTEILKNVILGNV